jgi:single-stranded-DNA-specific exonuclease
MLCGAGVAYQLACALNGGCEDLDLAALGTIADIVPLTGENRAIAATGLAQMRETPRLGLLHLARQSKADISRMTSERVAFALAPRLNAAGRLGDGSVPLNLLLTQSDQDASRLASELGAANDERRGIEEEIFQSAIAAIEKDLPEKLPAIVLANRAWHSGVVGIVAARIASRYNRPTLLVAYDEDGLGRGSARGGPGFNLADAIGVCKEHLVKFGGHKNAAGFTVYEAKFEAFREMFLAEASERLPGKVLQPELPIDILIGLSQIDGQLITAIERLEPFGQLNPSPVFCTCGVEVVAGSAQPIANKHLRMTLAQEGVRFPAIAYRILERMDPSELPKLVDIVYTPKFDTYRGGGAIQLELRDIATTPRL